MKKQYWAVGHNFDYDILMYEPNPMDWPCSEGPFDKLSEAKSVCYRWIKADIDELRSTRLSIQTYKVNKERF